MSFGGSVSAMISSLSNNANLLPRRKKYISRKPTLKEIRSYYPKKGIISNTRASKEELAVIRDRIIHERKEIIWLRAIYFLIVMSLILSIDAFTIPKIWFYIKPATLKTTHQIVNDGFDDRNSLFKHNIDRGKAELKANNWFFAAGQFELALKIKPEDAQANYLLALSYYKLCRHEGKGCVLAGNLIEELLINHPEIYNSSQLIIQFDTSYATK